MSHSTTYKGRVRVAHWSQLERWDVKAAQASAWQGSAHELRPLAEALSRYRADVPRTDSALADWQLVTVRFDGSMEPRTAKGTATFKGKLFAALPGHVIYSKIDARNGAIGIIPESLPRVAVSSEFPVYAIRAEVALPAYIKILFRSAQFQRLIQRLVSGASGRKRVEPAALERLAVPLPPLPIQEAIVAAYETGVAEAARLRLEAARLEAAAAESLTQHLGLPLLKIKEARRGAQIVPWSELGRWSLRSIISPLYFEGAYPLVMLGDVTDIAYGITKDPNNRPGLNAKPYLSVSNVQREGLDLRKVKTIEVTPTEQERYQLHYGDILVCEGNSADLVGRPAMWRDEIPECIHQNHILRVRAHEGKILPDFLLAYMNSPQARRYFYSRAKFTTNLASINSTDLKELPVPLPPLELQQQLITQDEQLRATAQAARTLAAETEAAAVARVEAMILGKS